MPNNFDWEKDSGMEINKKKALQWVTIIIIILAVVFGIRWIWQKNNQESFNKGREFGIKEINSLIVNQLQETKQLKIKINTETGTKYLILIPDAVKDEP